MALTKDKISKSAPDSLVCRTACVIYMAEHAGQPHVVAFEALHPSQHAKYERMAAAALTEAYREPVPEPLSA